MTMREIEDGTFCFGSPAQQRMEEKAHWLWPLLRDNPVYGYMGRSVGVDGATLDEMPALAALTRVQGATLTHHVLPRDVPDLTRAFADQGLVADRWDQFMGGDGAVAACETVVRDFRPPAGYALRVVGPDTDATAYRKLAETALASDVLPPVSAAIGGRTRRAVCLCLVAPDGEVAACSGAVMGNHRDSPWARTSWWGMLATRAQDRGKSLSLYLGALALLRMHETFGATTFYTGVRRDNAVSRHICEKLGVVESGYACMAFLDPAAFGDGGFTK